MKEIKPTNLELQKEKFMAAKGEYDPQFEYVSANPFVERAPHQKYTNLALGIIKSCLNEFRSEPAFSEQEGGPLMTQEEVKTCFRQYIDELNVRELISFEFTANTVAPTSVIHSNSDNTSRVCNLQRNRLSSDSRSCIGRIASKGYLTTKLGHTSYENRTIKNKSGTRNEISTPWDLTSKTRKD